LPDFKLLEVTKHESLLSEDCHADNASAPLEEEEEEEDDEKEGLQQLLVRTDC